tara:strand:- start:11453 stop:11743 length:291 start_codon:yes stop_codon:yes gene_type:complete
MIKTKKYFLLFGLFSTLFISSFYLVFQVYDLRVSFSELEELNKDYLDLSFRSNLLKSEIEYFRNQLTIREIATQSLAMHSPSLGEQIIVNREMLIK